MTSISPITLRRAALGLALSCAAVASAAADDNSSIGAEYEMNEGVIAYAKKHNKISAMYPEEIMNERFLCSTEASEFPGWPLISFTHDMGWDNSARTLEIVLGPTKDGDSASAPKQSAILQAVYRFLHAQRTSACNETVATGYCYVSVAEIMAAVPTVTDKGCGGDFLAAEPGNYHARRGGIIIAKSDGFTTDPEEHVATQITLGVKRAALIDMPVDKLFGKSRSARTKQRSDMYGQVQAAVRAKLGAKTKDQQALALYATYALISYLANKGSITKAQMGGDGLHAPVWKNAFVLYPKTSVVAVVHELSADASLTADSIYNDVAKGVIPARLEVDFKTLWNELREASMDDDEDPLDQAKPSSNTAVLLLEVRSPSSKFMTITNGGNKDTMTMAVPAQAM